MKDFYVYFHINPVKKIIFYVGKGHGDRAYTKYNRNKFWHNIVNKYGDPIIIIAKNNISENYAFELEKAYIKIFGRRDLNEGDLVNLTNGGEGSYGFIHSEETKEKISKSLKGDNHFMYSKNHNQKTLELMSSIKKDKFFLYETRMKMSNSAKKKKHSKETKEKISKSLMGNKSGLGYKHTQETKNKMLNNTNAICKKVYDTEKDIIYNSMKEAAKAFNISMPTLRKYLNHPERNKTPLILYYDKY